MADGACSCFLSSHPPSFLIRTKAKRETTPTPNTRVSPPCPAALDDHTNAMEIPPTTLEGFFQEPLSFDAFVTPTSSAVSMRKIPVNYLPPRVINEHDASSMFKYRLQSDNATNQQPLRMPTIEDFASFQITLQHEKEAVYRFANSKFQEKVVAAAQSMDCMKHPETGEYPVDLLQVKDIYRLCGDKIAVKKAIYVLQSKMWKENRQWALCWEKEYMQHCKVEYLETDADEGKKSRQKGGCIKDCIVRKVADLVKSFQDVGDVGFGEHIGERQPKSSQLYTALEGGGFVVKAPKSKKRKAVTTPSLSSIEVPKVVDDLSDMTPNSWPTDSAMKVLRLLKSRGTLTDELLQEFKDKQMIAHDFEVL